MATVPVAAPKRAKLSFKEARELASLPEKINALEAEQSALASRLAGSEIYANAKEDVAPALARAEAIEAELLAALDRWETLELMRG